MSVPLDYKDTVAIYKVDYNGYGDKTIESVNNIAALFLQSTGSSHELQRDTIDTTAHAYLDPEHPFVIDNAFRLEGMLVKANPFGSEESQAWYKINRVVVGQDKLLGNNIDNVHIYLAKSIGLTNVS